MTRHHASTAPARAPLFRLLPLVLAVSVGLAACGDKNQGAAPAASQQPPPVGVVTVQPSDLVLSTDLPGRIGRSQVTEGALVGQADATPLATIQQVNPLYVNLTQSATEVLALRSKLADGKLASAGGGAAKVQIVTEDGKPYPHEGKLLFSDLTVDPGTGQVNLRAEVANPDGMLLPGMYVRVRIEQAKIDNAILLPQQAVTRGEKDTAMVVGDDGAVSPRVLQISGQQDGKWIVVGGLKAGDKVMVDGFMKLQMGAKKFTPVPWQAGGKAPASAPQGAASGASAPAAAASK